MWLMEIDQHLSQIEGTKLSNDILDILEEIKKSGQSAETSYDKRCYRRND